MAPVYTFVGESPAVLVGLSQGVNAIHTPAVGNPDTPAGATIVAAPGDTVETHDDYNVVTLELAQPVAPVAPAAVPAEAPAPVEAPAPAPVEAPAPAPAPTF